MTDDERAMSFLKRVGLRAEAYPAEALSEEFAAVRAEAFEQIREELKAWYLLRAASLGAYCATDNARNEFLGVIAKVERAASASRPAEEPRA